MTSRWTTWVLAPVLVLAAASGCTRSAPLPAAPGLPDTSAQLAAARQYLAFVVEQRFDEAWQLEATTAGRRAVVLPYAWDMHGAWPAQQPGTIQLFDQAGQPLGLPAAS